MHTRCYICPMNMQLKHWVFKACMSIGVILKPPLHTVCTLILCIPTSHQQCPLNSSSWQTCRASNCLSCANAPANCSVDPISHTVSCTGETSSCRVLECDSCSHCVAYYYQNTYNFTTAYRFTSGCVSNDPTYSCDSSSPNCVGSGPVESESNLFGSNLIFCSCYANNCTANLSFHYTIVASTSTWKVSSSSSFSMQATFLREFIFYSPPPSISLFLSPMLNSFYNNICLLLFAFC